MSKPIELRGIRLVNSIDVALTHEGSAVVCIKLLPNHTCCSAPLVAA